MKAAHTEQMELALAEVRRTPEELAECLANAAGRLIRLAITRNRSAMASARFRAGAVDLRLDQGFLRAPDAVVEALRDYVATRSRAAWGVVGRYAATLVPAAPARPAEGLRTAGAVYDLAEIRDAVNRGHFGGRLKCAITWGRLAARPRRRAGARTMRFGSYLRGENLVRVNPLLDDIRVPRSFVEYIVFHEMLHAVVPSNRSDARWNHHHSTFKTLERQYPDLEEMKRLSGTLVGVLTSRRRRFS